MNKATSSRKNLEKKEICPGGTPIMVKQGGPVCSFEGPTKDYQMVQLREITLPIGGILAVTTL